MARELELAESGLSCLPDPEPLTNGVTDGGDEAGPARSAAAAKGPSARKTVRWSPEGTDSGPLGANLEDGDVSAIRLEELPPIPGRAGGYYGEPWCGTVLIGVISGVFLRNVYMISSDEGRLIPRAYVVTAMWCCFAVAWLSFALILFGGAGVIGRSPATCNPIPEEVRRRIHAMIPLHGMGNIILDDDEKQGTYCVRCCVWRPPPSYSTGVCHHCSTCNRCVRGFDHHCGVLGRCIVSQNMPFFYTLISMFFVGLFVLALSMV